MWTDGIINHRQYVLKQGYTITTAWLDNGDLKKGMRVKLTGDPFWWTVIGMGDTVKTMRVPECTVTMDGCMI